MAQFIMNVADAEKEAFMEAARLCDRNASQLVREFMRDFVERQRYEAYVQAEVERGLADIVAGRVITADAADNQVQAWLDGHTDGGQGS